MNIRSINIILILFVCVTIVGFTLQTFTHFPIWPIFPGDDPDDWNTISCTFGEIHGAANPLFHGGIDIGIVDGTHLKSIKNGVILICN